jgi:hypothetical protein
LAGAPFRADKKTGFAIATVTFSFVVLGFSRSLRGRPVGPIPFQLCVFFPLKIFGIRRFEPETDGGSFLQLIAEKNNMMAAECPPDVVNTAPCGFEGAEKKIEVEFKQAGAFSDEGLRLIPQEKWQEILDVIKCQVVSKTSNEHFDSYVLSESSLFVYPLKVVMKTCGTTITLLCLEPLLKMAKELAGLEPDFFWYARKNFQFPDKQIFPHTGFDDEVRISPDCFFTFAPFLRVQSV